MADFKDSNPPQTVFRDVNWDEPLSVADLRSQIPTGKTERGLSFNALKACLKEAGKAVPAGWPTYIPFSRYPVTEHVDRIVETAGLAFGGLPLRRAIFEVGRAGFRHTANSMVLKVIYTLADVTIHTALKSTSKVYQTTGDGTAEVLVLEEKRVVIAYRGLWSFADCLHVGALHEGFRHYKLEPRFRVRRLGLADVDVEATW